MLSKTRHKQDLVVIRKELRPAFKVEIKNSLLIIDAINDIEFKSNAIKESLIVKKQNYVFDQ